MNLVCDEGVERPIVQHFRERGHHVVYVAEFEPGIPDEAILAMVVELSAPLITNDRDVGELVFRQRLTPLTGRKQAVEGVMLRAATAGLMLILVLGGSGGVKAQVGSPGDCQSEAGGTIRGVVVNDSTRVPVPRSYIYLIEPAGCRTTADVLGRFVVHRVPSGTLRIATGFPGYRQFRPVTVELTTGDTTDVELRLGPGGPLQDCRALPSCSVLVDGGRDSIQDEDAGFRLVALGTAIGLAWETVVDDAGWYACLDDESEAVRSALSERYSLVVSAEECELSRDPSGTRLRHIETNRAAFRPAIDRVVEVNPRRRTVSLSYYVDPLWAAGWDCDFERTDRGWRATICVETWES